MRNIANVPGNLPSHNPYFVGRETEMQRLHEAVGMGRFGMLTVLQGMGGLGKSALAIQYAYGYADFYTGGRWLVGCAGKTTLAAALRELDIYLKIQLSSSENNDDTRAAKRILAELEKLAREGAAARSGEMNPPPPRTLLLLDNVEDAALLQTQQTDLISGKSWLHVVATTRLPEADLSQSPNQHTLLCVDELAVEDAVRLIERYQPGECFPNKSERAAAVKIARLLGGFTLALEVVAIYIGERRGQVTCTAFHDRLSNEVLGGLEKAAKSTKTPVRHRERHIGATLGPTLDLLSGEESLALAYSALLPPDCIPLPWLRDLVSNEYPELKKDAESGYDDPLLDLVNHLLGLRLLQVADTGPDNHTPLRVKMNRLVAELVRDRFNSTRNIEEVTSLLMGKLTFVKTTDDFEKWEMDALLQAVPTYLDEKTFLRWREHSKNLLVNFMFLSNKIKAYRGLSTAYDMLLLTHRAFEILVEDNQKNIILKISWTIRLIQNKVKIANLLYCQGKITEASDFQRACLPLIEFLSKKNLSYNPLNHQAIRDCKKEIAHFMLKTNNFRIALKLFEELLSETVSQLSRSLSETEKSFLLHEIARDHVNISYTLGKLKMQEEAITHQADALNALNQSLDSLPKLGIRDMYDWSRSKMKKMIGEILFSMRKLDEALNAYQESLLLASHTLKVMFSNQPKDREVVYLSCVYEKIGDVLNALNRQEEALKSYQKGMTRIGKLLRKRDGNSDYHYRIVELLKKRAEVFLDQGEKVKAKTALSKALIIIRQLADADSSNTIWLQEIALVQRQLEKTV
jgi:tetratricopeptide (TPR) repeat protein